MDRERFDNIWDRSGALNRLLNDETLLQRMLGMFQQCAEQSIEDIEKAIEQNNYTAINAIAHKLKGSASAVGAIKVTTAAINIESAAQNEDIEAVMIGLSSLKSDTNEISLLISDYLAENG